MPRTAAATFEKRQPNFFKANSHVDMATGFDVKGMRATVGFISTSLRGDNNYSVRELEQQEYGGKIPKRTFIPLNSARVGESHSRLVKPENRLTNIKNIIKSESANGNSSKAKFIAAVFKAGRGGYVIGNIGPKYKLYRVLEAGKGEGKMKIRIKPLYSVMIGRAVGIHKTGFMQRASLDSASRLYIYYASEANRQIQRLMAKGAGTNVGNARGARGSFGRFTRSIFR